MIKERKNRLFKKTTNKSGAAILAEVAYLYLRLEQSDDGLWFSASSGQLTHDPHGLPTPKTEAHRSISVTSFSIISIFSSTRNYRNPAIISALNAILLKRDKENSGGFGPGLTPHSTMQGVQNYNILSCRHTASAAVALHAMKVCDNSELLLSLDLILLNQNKDGGWSVYKGTDSDCISTAYCLEFLTICMGIFTEKTEKILQSISCGNRYLESNYRENNGYLVFGKNQYVCATTGITLSLMPNYLRSSAIPLDLIAEIRRIASSISSDFSSHAESAEDGWPSAPGGRIELGATAFCAAGLQGVGSNDHSEIIKRSIKFLGRTICIDRAPGALDAADWAAALLLVSRAGYTLDRQTEKYLNTLHDRILASRNRGTIFKIATRFSLRNHCVILLNPKTQHISSYKNIIIDSPIGWAIKNPWKIIRHATRYICK